MSVETASMQSRKLKRVAADGEMLFGMEPAREVCKWVVAPGIANVPVGI